MNLCGRSVPGRWPIASSLVLAGLVASTSVGVGHEGAGAPASAGELLITGTANAAGAALADSVVADSSLSAVYPRPNIVVLMLDDIGAIDDRVWERLPNIDKRFRQRGIRATQFYGETPTCSPGRVGFLTGLHTQGHGVTRNQGSLFKPSMSIATQLRRRGYQTILAGKYLNGYESITPKVPPGWSEFHAFNSGYYGYSMWSNGKRTYHGRKPSDYSTDVVTGKLLASLTRAPRDKPVFVWASPWAAHKPRTAAPRHKDDPRCAGIKRWKPPGYMERNVSDKPRWIRQLDLRLLEGKAMQPTCRSLLAVDDLLGKVVAKLATQGRLKNTLFILTADNGMNYGMHRLLNDKKSPYAIQLPFFVSWNKRIEPSRGPIRERLQNIDLAPTLCALAGCTMGPYPTGQARPDGRSFADLLLGRTKWLKREAVLQTFRNASAWIPRWWGVETTRSSPLAYKGCALAAKGGCRWTFVRYETGAKELYDVSNGPCWQWRSGEPGDPCRLVNLAGRKRYSAIQQSLQKRLAELKKE